MADLIEVILESWDRQAKIVANVSGLITPELADATSGEGEWTIAQHLGHVLGTRLYFLSGVQPGSEKGLVALPRSEVGPWFDGDLDALRTGLDASAKRVREVLEPMLRESKEIEPYDHPIFFLQHMVWHEGWHVSSIIRSMRAVGQEPAEEWEEENVWQLWRKAGY